MVWQSIVAGANGVFFFAFWDFLRSPDVTFTTEWARLSKIAADVDRFAPMLLSDAAPATKVTLGSDQAVIWLATRSHWAQTSTEISAEKQMYVFAVNDGNGGGPASFALGGGYKATSVHVVSESPTRTIKAEPGGGFSDMIQRLDVVVYLVQCSNLASPLKSDDTNDGSRTDVIDVRAFGAKADGKFDNTAVFASAAKACNQTNGCTFLVPLSDASCLHNATRSLQVVPTDHLWFACTGYKRVRPMKTDDDRSVELYIWAAANGECAACAQLSPSSDSCARSKCNEPSKSCINGSSCAFLPPIVDAALRDSIVSGAQPFLSGVIAYLGIGLSGGGIHPPGWHMPPAVLSRPPTYTYGRASAMAAVLHRQNLSFSAMVNGVSLTQFHSFLHNRTSITTFINVAVADAVEFGFDGYSFDWEASDGFSHRDTHAYAAFLVELEKELRAASRTTRWQQHHTGSPRGPRVSVATGGIGYYGMPGTAGFCGHWPDDGIGWNCSEVDAAALAGSKVAVYPMNTYDSRDSCWYSYAAAINRTVPLANRGIALSTCRGANCSFSEYMEGGALGKRFAALQQLQINQIALFGDWEFNALPEYIPLLRRFLAGDAVLASVGHAVGAGPGPGCVASGSCCL